MREKKVEVEQLEEGDRKLARRKLSRRKEMGGDEANEREYGSQ